MGRRRRRSGELGGGAPPRGREGGRPAGGRRGRRGSAASRPATASLAAAEGHVAQTLQCRMKCGRQVGQGCRPHFITRQCMQRCRSAVAADRTSSHDNACRGVALPWRSMLAQRQAGAAVNVICSVHIFMFGVTTSPAVAGAGVADTAAGGGGGGGGGPREGASASPLPSPLLPLKPPPKAAAGTAVTAATATAPPSRQWRRRPRLRRRRLRR